MPLSYNEMVIHRKEAFMGIRTRRARTRSRTHIVSFSIAGFFGFIALFVMAMFLSVGALVTN